MNTKSAGTERGLQGLALARRVSSTAPGAAKLARFRRAVLIQGLIAALPVAGLLFIGKASLAGPIFWSIFALLGLRLAILGRADELLCLLLALAPFFNLLRDFAFYNVVAAVFLVGLAYYYVRLPATFTDVLRRSPLALLLAAFVTVYWAFSFALTGEYAINSRGFEFCFSVITVLIVGRKRAVLSAALVGLMISAVAIGVAMIPHIGSFSERLGMVEIEGILLGNPIQLGLPLALSLLALAIDGGAWLGFKRQASRFAFLLAVFALLALTTSRAAWLVAAIGLLIALLFGTRQRLGILSFIGLGVVSVELLLLSPYGEGLQNGLDRTFSEDRDTRSRTSGRSDQWIVTYEAFSESAGSALHGYGPGLGGKVYARKSMEVPGIEYGVGHEVALHSFYMQVAVESGLLGLVPLVAWLLVALRRTVGWSRRQGLWFPLACLLGYVMVALTVSGYDTVSGGFLGIGLLAQAAGPGKGSVPSRQLAVAGER